MLPSLIVLRDDARNYRQGLSVPTALEMHAMSNAIRATRAVGARVGEDGRPDPLMTPGTLVECDLPRRREWPCLVIDAVRFARLFRKAYDDQGITLISSKHVVLALGVLEFYVNVARKTVRAFPEEPDDLDEEAYQLALEHALAYKPSQTAVGRFVLWSRPSYSQTPFVARVLSVYDDFEAMVLKVKDYNEREVERPPTYDNVMWIGDIPEAFLEAREAAKPSTAQLLPIPKYAGPSREEVLRELDLTIPKDGSMQQEKPGPSGPSEPPEPPEPALALKKPFKPGVASKEQLEAMKRLVKKATTDACAMRASTLRPASQPASYAQTLGASVPSVSSVMCSG